MKSLSTFTRYHACQLAFAGAALAPLAWRLAHDSIAAVWSL